MLSCNGERRCHTELIGMYGYPGSGKDTVALMLEEKGWESVAFADPIKEMLIAMDPWIEEEDEDGMIVERLSELIDEYGCLEEVKRRFKEVRRLMQRLGTEGGRGVLGDDVWCDIGESRIKDWLAKGYNVAVTDVRFPNEAKLIKRLGGYLVEVRRGGCDANGHASESHYNSFPKDFILYNEGSLTDLRTTVMTLCQKI
jgi:hypothetical protein